MKFLEERRYVIVFILLLLYSYGASLHPSGMATDDVNAGGNFTIC